MLENWEALTSYDKAFFYALLDEKDRTVQWSQKAFDENYTRVTGLRLYPHFDPDPRRPSLRRPTAADEPGAVI